MRRATAGVYGTRVATAGERPGRGRPGIARLAEGFETHRQGLSDGGAEARGPGVPPAKPGTCARRAGLVRLTFVSDGAGAGSRRSSRGRRSAAGER